MYKKSFLLILGFPFCVAAQQLPEPVIRFMQNETFVRTATSFVNFINQTPLTQVADYLGEIHTVRQEAHLPPLTPDYRDYQALVDQGVPPAQAYVNSLIPDCLQMRSCGLGEGVRQLKENQ